MRTSKFTDSQILAILKEYESGQTAKELSLKYRSLSENGTKTNIEIKNYSKLN